MTALRIIERFDGKQVQTVVKRDAQWDEYLVEFWYLDTVHGRFAHRPQADYRTTDKQDALDTARTAASV